MILSIFFFVFTFSSKLANAAILNEITDHCHSSSAVGQELYLAVKAVENDLPCSDLEGNAGMYCEALRAPLLLAPCHESIGNFNSEALEICRAVTAYLESFERVESNVSWIGPYLVDHYPSYVRKRERAKNREYLLDVQEQLHRPHVSDLSRIQSSQILGVTPQRENVRTTGLGNDRESTQEVTKKKEPSKYFFSRFRAGLVGLGSSIARKLGLKPQPRLLKDRQFVTPTPKDLEGMGGFYTTGRPSTAHSAPDGNTDPLSLEIRARAINFALELYPLLVQRDGERLVLFKRDATAENLIRFSEELTLAALWVEKAAQDGRKIPSFIPEDSLLKLVTEGGSREFSARFPIGFTQSQRPLALLKDVRYGFGKLKALGAGLYKNVYLAVDLLDRKFYAVTYVNGAGDAQCSRKWAVIQKETALSELLNSQGATGISKMEALPSVEDACSISPYYPLTFAEILKELNQAEKSADGAEYAEYPVYEGTLVSEVKKRLALEILQSAKNMHDLGWKNRDFKPDNILYWRDNWEQPHPIIIDLGSAWNSKQVDLDLHTFFDFTPLFASPELARFQRSFTEDAKNKVIDLGDHPAVLARVGFLDEPGYDTWALGLTLYSLNGGSLEKLQNLIYGAGVFHSKERIQSGLSQVGSISNYEELLEKSGIDCRPTSVEESDLSRLICQMLNPESSARPTLEALISSLQK